MAVDRLLPRLLAPLPGPNVRAIIERDASVMSPSARTLCGSAPPLVIEDTQSETVLAILDSALPALEGRR